jgi:hypothetical protein
MAIATIGLGPNPTIGLGNALSLKNLFGLGDAGCPVLPNGNCDYGGMEIPCSYIRECDYMTGAVHYEYAMPESTGNVNIAVATPDQVIIGYNDAEGDFVDTPDYAIPPPPPPDLLVPATPPPNNSTVNAPTGGNTTSSLTSTPQTTTSQQGNPATVTVTNANASTSSSTTAPAGSNSVNPSSPTYSSGAQNFSSLASAGATTAKNWLNGTTMGISNIYLVIGGAAALYFGQQYLNSGSGRKRGF